MSSYEYDLDQCDVRCKECLKQFRKKRDEWLDWLENDSEHAISKQITQMLWSDAAFRLFNLSRKYASENGSAFSTLNGVLASSLDRGFVLEQLTMIRRLIEPENRQPKRQVISLRRLLNDIKNNRDFLTREHFVCYDGLRFEAPPIPFDLEKRSHGVSFVYLPTSGPEAPLIPDINQRAFDKFANTNEDQRSRDDLVSKDYIFELENKLCVAPFSKLNTFANKLLLHAADPVSRGTQSIDAPTLESIWACHKAILIVANELSLLIGSSNIGAVPYPQFDVFENWSEPFAPSNSFDQIREEWDKANEERESWIREGLR